ncbi:modulator of macroautophagy TMEM150B [Sander lucioperca]|uniref:Transmembrane protein 150B n=1 Tax=Sander lucioperca TaxID=283035 RepID=A0A8C9Y2A5_SANLU|nr:modulator of macroautophagy TMEM150B [Sander lucioperca]
MWLWALLPISLAVFGTVGVWTVFAVAVRNGSVNLTEGVPYISVCGSYTPQSCLFSQICNIISFLALWIVLIRFKHVRDNGNHGKANTASIVLGLISSVGLSILGNFQESVLLSIHLLGAYLAFYLGLAYFWVQLFLTYRAPPSQDRCWVTPARATCCTLCTILVILMTSLGITGFHSGAAVCEWAMVMLFFGLFSLFATEFRHINCQLTVRESAIRNDYSSSSTEIHDHVANALS